MKKRLDSIQVLRALAFLGILCLHCGLANLGTWGVSVFFVLSGFILTLKSLSEGKVYAASVWEGVHYSKSKIKKLYSTHIVTMLTMLLLVLYQMYINGILNQWWRQGGYVVLNLLLIQNWSASYEVRCSLNGVAWYLSAMTFLYFAFPFIFNVVGKYKRRRDGVLGLGFAGFTALVVALLLHKLNQDMFYFTYFFPPYRCLDFFAGCNLGYIFYESNNRGIVAKQENKACFIRYTIYELAGAVLAGITVYVHWNILDMEGNTDWRWIIHDILYLPSSCALVYLFARERGLITRGLKKLGLIKLGNISGYMFLIHYPILHYFQSLCLKVSGKFVNPVLQTICVLLLSMLFTHLWLWVCKCFKTIKAMRTS